MPWLLPALTLASLLVKLAGGRGSEHGWATRCLAPGHFAPSVTGALEAAARCAMNGVSRR